MQYVGQTCRFLRTRFTQHYRRMIKKISELIVFFIYISNTFTILLVIFLCSLWKNILLLLNDVEIFSCMN